MSIAILPRKEQSLGAHLLQGTVIAIVLTALSFVVGIQVGWIEGIIGFFGWLEVFAVFTSYLCTFLCVVERRGNYPIGAISNAAYSWLFFQWGLVASGFVTGYLTLALAYGWFRWRSDKKTLPVSRVELKWVPAYIVSTAAFYGLALWIVTMMGGNFAMTDTFILIGTILAQFLLDNKKIETWAVWAVVNVFAIYTYYNAGLYLVVFQYMFFLANTLYGYVMWRKSRAKAKTIPNNFIMSIDGDEFTTYDPLTNTRGELV